MRDSSRPILTIAADGVGLVSSVLGSFLAVAPRPGGRWLGLSDTGIGTRRALGCADVALGTAILATREQSLRWCVVAARAVLHLAFAREYWRTGGRSSAAAMCALFVVDTGIAIGLCRTEFPRHSLQGSIRREIS